MVWNSYLQDGSENGIFGQRYDSNGNEAGSEFQINTHTTNSQYRPAVAENGAGNFAVVWQSDGQDGDRRGVFGQRYDSSGLATGSEFQINSYTTNYQDVPAIAVDSAGRFMVLWQSIYQDFDSYGVFGQRYSSTGAEAGSEFQVNETTQFGQDFPAVAADNLGNFVVAWHGAICFVSCYQSESDREGISARRYSSDGTAVGSSFRVNSFTTFEQQYPAVAVDAAGRFVVVWQSYKQDGSDFGIFGQRYDSSGNEVASEFQVNSYTTGSQYGASVASDDAGNFVVVWTDKAGHDGEDWGIFGQLYDSAGNKSGGEFQINSYTTSFQAGPTVATRGAGSFVVVWVSVFQDGGDEGVFGRQLGIGIFADGFDLRSGDTCEWSDQVGSSDDCP